MISWLGADAADVPAADGWLLAAERDVLAGLRVAKRRGDWRLGRWTAKGAVAAALGIPAAEVQVRAATDGAPEAFHDGAPLPVTLSISHRAGRAVCVVAAPAMPVGCDLELVEPRAAGFAADWFTGSECALVEAAAAPERDRVVTMVWSAKESALKALRCGLRRDTRSVAVSVADGLVDGWQRLRIDDEEAGSHLDGWWRPHADLLLTVVTAEPSLPPRPLVRDRAAGAA